MDLSMVLALQTLPNVSKAVIRDFSRPSISLALNKATTLFMCTAMSSLSNEGEAPTRVTKVLRVNPAQIGDIAVINTGENLLDDWEIKWNESTTDFSYLHIAAENIQQTNIPVAFPTETVYGLGADATRSGAVRGIYTAKQRPSDNPLIVHVASLKQLRCLLRPGITSAEHAECIPAIYEPLIQRFWPGPLTIIVPNPRDSILAPEVTAGLDTFGARMPRSIIALALIKLAGVPLAAPSANASTKPSPTAAEHVKEDLEGRIDTIIDGGPCEIGVESTVVDGLSHPPAILRPGGISIDQIRQCTGWKDVVIGYQDNASTEDGAKPRAPGMKYRHYSPKARVILFEATSKPPSLDDMLLHSRRSRSIGVIRTRVWPRTLSSEVEKSTSMKTNEPTSMLGCAASATTTALVDSNAYHANGQPQRSTALKNLLRSFDQHRIPIAEQIAFHFEPDHEVQLWDINLGAELEGIGRGLFSALRELDHRGVEVIFVEGVADNLGNVAAAVMNRLRKAAEVVILKS